ncbi:dihydrofolate reductase family protein [Thalassobius sp. MITS945101]|uniref:dihydrofolate reductase family protein n=1 Tax=Thalassobius sp. MITS945101 TaxID=3096994 RepID=UPI00399965AB
MREIIYDVAVTLDGYIAAPDGDVSAFPQAGPHAVAYAQRLATYDTVLMGRATYEFAYDYGLPPGARAYPHMVHYIFSSSIALPEDTAVNAVRSDWLKCVTKLREQTGAAIYLCGGGQFAGWMLSENLIDRLVLKRVPITLGGGIPLFGGKEGNARVPEDATWQCLGTSSYGNGVVLETYGRRPA